MFCHFRKSSDKLVTAMDQLTESEEVLNKALAQTKVWKGKMLICCEKQVTNVSDEIKAFRETINGKTSDKQGLSRNPFK